MGMRLTSRTSSFYTGRIQQTARALGSTSENLVARDDGTWLGWRSCVRGTELLPNAYSMAGQLRSLLMLTLFLLLVLAYWPRLYNVMFPCLLVLRFFKHVDMRVQVAVLKCDDSTTR